MRQIAKGVFAVKVAVEYTRTLYHREIIEVETIAEANEIAQAQCEEGLQGPDAFEDSSEITFDLEALLDEDLEDVDTSSGREEGEDHTAI